MKIPAFAKNFYLISLSIFLIWILLFDSNDLITQSLRRSRLKKLKKEKEYFQKEIKKIEQQQEDLINNPKVVEKLAREKFYMKKPEEDVYVILPEPKPIPAP